MADEFKSNEKTRFDLPGEIVTPGQRAMVWMTRNATLLTYAGGGLVFLALLLAGFVLVQGNRTTSANMALLEAVNFIQPLAQRNGAAPALSLTPERMAEGLAAFQELANKYPSRPQGKAASLYAANLYFSMGSYRKAAATVEELAARDPDFAARYGGNYLLAKAYEAERDYGKALATFAHVRDRSAGEMLSQVLLDMARVSQLSGDTGKAAELYGKVKEGLPPDHPLAQRADKMLILLGVDGSARK